jgi:hypothetical protein
VIALCLFFVVMRLIRFMKRSLGFSLSLLPTAATIVFALAAVAVLPALRWLFRRPVDVYDIGQTVLLCVLFYLIVRRLERGRSRLSPDLRSARYRAPTPRSRRYAAPGREMRPSPKRSAGYQALYQNLLRKVGGDHTTVLRLIEYERVGDPGASDIELLESAIWRWERDNR